MFVNNLNYFYRFLANVCMCSQAFKKAPDDPKLRFPTVSNYLKQNFNLKTNRLSQNTRKLIVHEPCESTTKEISCEW